jgi:hypothetical protein
MKLHAPPPPLLLTMIMKAIVIPRATSSDRSRGADPGKRAVVADSVCGKVRSSHTVCGFTSFAKSVRSSEARGRGGGAAIGAGCSEPAWWYERDAALDQSRRVLVPQVVPVQVDLPQPLLTLDGEVLCRCLAPAWVEAVSFEKRAPVLKVTDVDRLAHGPAA